MRAIEVLKSSFLVMAGTLVLAFAMAVFVVPFDLVMGGVTGIAVVAEHWINNAYFSVDLIVLVLTWFLFFFGVIFFGRSFAIKTLLSTLLYPPALSFFLNRFVSNRVFSYLFTMETNTALLFASVMGGALVGLGCALTFLGGGSTGGTDIIALWISKSNPKWRSATVIFAIDACVIFLGIVVMGDVLKSVCGIVSAWIGSVVIASIV